MVRHRIGLDRLAIGLSGLCLLHCIGTLLIVATMASAGGFLLAPEFHEIGLGLALAVGTVALGHGIIVHRRPLPLAIGAVGLALMATALTLDHGPGEALCTIVGVLLVAAGHQLNRRALR
ncbi:MAG: MerC protein [Sphingomonas bacterium]|nr:MerC domain-containing protein [Sphingomonas bacterium]MDB5690653.1 MerC protein [Sphingomonas bacterium]